jgi:hypothetical protein
LPNRPVTLLHNPPVHIRISGHRHFDCFPQIVHSRQCFR